MKIEETDIKDLIAGYTKLPENKGFTCNYCGKVFETGVIYRSEECFYEAKKATEMHIKDEHGGNAKSLLFTASKYNPFTDTQKELLGLMSSGVSDAEIAKSTGVTPSTVRHQKFTFREKLKQAKFTLAILENCLTASDNGENIIPIHDGATFIDDRFIITETERDSILKAVFTSINPLKLKYIPKKDKKKVVILNEIIKLFDAATVYNEKEVSDILKEVYFDYVTLRRALIDYGYMVRNAYGSEYRVK